MLDEVIKDMIEVFKKAPELSHDLVSQQLSYHKTQILQSMDAVPMHVFEHQMKMLRSLMIKLDALEEKMARLEDGGS